MARRTRKSRTERPSRTVRSTSKRGVSGTTSEEPNQYGQFDLVVSGIDIEDLSDQGAFGGLLIVEITNQGSETTDNVMFRNDQLIAVSGCIISDADSYERNQYGHFRLLDGIKIIRYVFRATLDRVMTQILTVTVNGQHIVHETNYNNNSATYEIVFDPNFYSVRSIRRIQ